jgi:Ni/Co efflux regulator RcnB
MNLNAGFRLRSGVGFDTGAAMDRHRSVKESQMKRSAVYLVALSLLASAATFAAGDPRKREAHVRLNPAVASHERHDRGGEHRGNDHRNDHRDGRRDNDRRNDHRNDRRNDHRNGPDHDRRDWDRRDNRDHNRPSYGHDNRGHDNRGWDRYRNDWNRHPNYWDNRRHDRADHARYRFHYGYYTRPSGYYHRAWHRGDRLPRSWYGPSYIVYDWHPYRLYSPPHGYHWVRVGDDVLLTAVATGIVLDVIYNIWY